MTQISSKDGHAVYFPLDPAAPPPADDTLPAIVEKVDPDQLHRFARRLVDAAQRRRYERTAAPMNLARLKLVRLCIDRLIAEGGSL